MPILKEFIVEAKINSVRQNIIVVAQSTSDAKVKFKALQPTATFLGVKPK